MLIGLTFEVCTWAFLFFALIVGIGRCIKKRQRVPKLKGKTVLITGGSLGIGKGIAKILIEKEEIANIIIVARNQEKLDSVKEEIENLCKENQKVITYSCDVCDEEAVKKMYKYLIEENKYEIDILFTSHGLQRPYGYFIELPTEAYKRMMDVNYLGVVKVVNNLMPYFLKSANDDNPKFVCIVASALSALTTVGETAYAPSKYALRGYAESMEAEMQGFPIHFSIAYPTDTDTPGFKEASVNKPSENIEILESGEVKLMSAEKTAQIIMKCLKRGWFYLNSTFEINCAITWTRGMGPVYENPWWEALRIWFLGPISIIVSNDFRSKALKSYKKRKIRIDDVLSGKVEKQKV